MSKPKSKRPMLPYGTAIKIVSVQLLDKSEEDDLFDKLGNFRLDALDGKSATSKTLESWKEENQNIRAQIEAVRHAEGWYAKPNYQAKYREFISQTQRKYQGRHSAQMYKAMRRQSVTV